jgi:hypothetical protein
MTDAAKEASSEAGSRIVLFADETLFEMPILGRTTFCEPGGTVWGEACDELALVSLADANN